MSGTVPWDQDYANVVFIIQAGFIFVVYVFVYFNCDFLISFYNVLFLFCSSCKTHDYKHYRHKLVHYLVLLVRKKSSMSSIPSRVQSTLIELYFSSMFWSWCLVFLCLFMNISDLPTKSPLSHLKSCSFLLQTIFRG